jgi:hypothetical protein
MEGRRRQLGVDLFDPINNDDPKSCDLNCPRQDASNPRSRRTMFGLIRA